MLLCRCTGYSQIVESAQGYIDLDDYRDGRWFRKDFAHGGYIDPPFPVTRVRTAASVALRAAVESLCEFPEYRWEKGELPAVTAAWGS